MQYRSWQFVGPLLVLLLFPILGVPQERPPAKKQPPEAPKPRLDLYGDPLPEGAVARLGTVRIRELGGIYAAASSPDLRYLACAAWEAPAFAVWDTTSGKVLRRIWMGEVMSLAFAPDGRTLGVGCSGQIRLVDVGTGKTISTIPVPPPGDERFAITEQGIHILAFSRDARRVASASLWQPLRVWEVETGKELFRSEPKVDPKSSIVFSPDGKSVAAGCARATIRVWDLATGKEMVAIEVPPPDRDPDDPVARNPHQVGPIAFSPDGETLASVGVQVNNDPTVHLWDASTGRELSSLRAPKTGFHCVSFSRDGAMIAAGGWSVHVWDVDSGEDIADLPGRLVSHLAFSPDGQRLLTVNSNPGVIRLWDLKTGGRKGALPGHRDFVEKVAFSPDGRTVASGGAGGSLWTWDAATGRAIHEFSGHASDVTFIMFSPDGLTLVSTGDDSLLHLWDVKRGVGMGDFSFYRLVSEWGPAANTTSEEDGTRRDASRDLAEGKITTFTFSPDSQALALGTLGGKIGIWNIDSRKVCHEIQGHKGPIHALAFGSKGTILFSFGSDGFARGWKEATLQKLAEIQASGEGVWCASFSPRGETFSYGGGDGKIHLWETARGREMHVMDGDPWGVTTLEFSDDGRKLLSCGAYPTRQHLSGGRSTITGEYAMYRVWDVSSGLGLFSLRAYSGWTRSKVESQGVARTAAFSPDGRALASGGLDEELHVWELATGRESHVFTGHGRGLNSVSFSPDGRLVASASFDTTILVWDLDGQHSRPASTGEGTMLPATEDLWAAIAEGDPRAAVRAMAHLADRADETVAFLAGWLRPAREENREQIELLVAQLNHDDFRMREVASAELERRGPQARPALLRALEDAPTPEVESRISLLLRGIGPPFESFPNDELQVMRGVQVLERIGTEAAAELLESLATGSPYALQTREAKVALDRLEGREAR